MQCRSWIENRVKVSVLVVWTGFLLLIDAHLCKRQPRQIVFALHATSPRRSFQHQGTHPLMSSTSKPWKLCHQGAGSPRLRNTKFNVAVYLVLDATCIHIGDDSKSYPAGLHMHNTAESGRWMFAKEATDVIKPQRSICRCDKLP